VVRSAVRFPIALAAASLVILLVPSARADASSWFYGGGGAIWPSGEASGSHPMTLQLDMGVGSSPASPLAVGGIFKMMTMFGQGTDLALATRFATGGFVRGGYGVALDLGGYERWWGQGSAGFLGSLVLGAPLGLQFTAMTEQGSNAVHAYGGTIGIDFLRLTVYRTSLQDFWPNPFPATRAHASR
jgi:hypothetical protein